MTHQEKVAQAEKDAVNIIKANRLIKDRDEKLQEMGYTTVEAATGESSNFNTIERKDRTLIQFTYGWTRHNYAWCIEIKKAKQND